MKALLLSVFALVFIHETHGQEFISTDLDLDITPVNSCLSCDGECEVTMEDIQEYTYRWNDDSGAILLIETNTVGFSSIQNLCLGSYQVIVSSGSEVVEETFFSVLEDSVDLGNSGAIYSCTDFETLDLLDFFPDAQTAGAVWFDQYGNEVDANIETSNLTQYYELELNNNGCLNSAIYPLVVNEPGYPGEGTDYVICEDFNEFNLIEPMADDNPDPNGTWLDSNGEEVVSGVYYPATGETEVFTYLIDSVSGCLDEYATLEIIRNVLPYAGEDEVAVVCSISDSQLDLNDYLDTEAGLGGFWSDQFNNPISNVLEEAEIEEGLYRYSLIGGAPCPADVSYIEVVFVDEISAGDNNTLEVCSNEGEVNLSSLIGAASAFGTWYGPAGDVVSCSYDPEEGLEGIFEYHVSATGCELETSTINIVNELFNFAGEDSLIVFCEDGELIDLAEYFSGDNLINGVWLSGENELESSFLIPNLGESSFVYRSNHTICPIEEAFISIEVDDNPAFPQVQDLFLCASDDGVSLTEEAGLDNDLWDIEWFDSDGILFSDIFQPELGDDLELSFEVNSNNSCPNLESNMTVLIEDNAFQNQALLEQFCSTEGSIDLNSLIPVDVSSASYIIMDDQGNEINSSVSPAAGISTYTFVEQGLIGCIPSELEMSLSVLQFIDAGEDESLIYCEAPGSLNLNDLVTVPGAWFVNDFPLIIEEIEYLPVNSGLYTFEAFNDPICESSEANFQLDFVSGFPYESIPDVTTCLDQPIFIEYPVNPSEFDIQIDAQYSEGIGLIEIINIGIGVSELIYTITDGFCTVTDSFQITVADLFNPMLSDDMIVCTGEDVNFSIDDQSVNTVWYVNGEQVGEDLMEYQFPAFSNTEVSVEAVNNIGCLGQTSGSVVVNQSPLVLIDEFDLAQCAPFTVQLSNVYNEDENTIYSWRINDDIYYSTSHLLEVGEGDVYDISLSAISSNGCSSDNSLPSFVEGWSNSYALFSSSENNLSYLSPITEFTNESVEFENLNWYIDEELVETQSEFWQYEFPDEEYVSYEVCLEAITTNSCSSVYCENVFVNSELLVYVPNAFTPNNDGVNETFYPEMKGHALDEFELIIFDRWGSVIYTSNDPSEHWMGNVKSGSIYAPSGVYSYSLSVKSKFTAELAHFKGHVTLSR